MAKLWGAEERRPRSRADCLLWTLLGFFLLVEGLVLSTAFLPSFDAAAQQQEQQRAQHPAPIPLPTTAADRQDDRAADGRPALGMAEDSRAATFTSQQPRTVGDTAPPPGTESIPTTATAVPGRREDGEGGKDRGATTPSTLLHVSRRWLLP